MILHSDREGNDCIWKLQCHCIQILRSDIYSVLKLYFSKGIKKYADTLSEKGGYCHFEANATYDCAICVAGMNTYSLLMLIKHMIVFVSTLL